jgi:hypothetical protein
VDVGNVIGVVDNISSTLTLPLLARGAGAHVKTKMLPMFIGGYAIPDVRLADHSPFNAGYETATASNSSLMRDTHLHHMNGTIYAIDLPSLQQLLK